MSKLPFIQSRAPKIWNGKYSAVLPKGWGFVMDTDGITHLTDSDGRLLIVQNDQ